MTESKWNELKEKQFKSKTKSNQPRRNTFEVERIFQNLFGKTPKAIEYPIKKIINDHQTKTVYSVRTWHSI